jgi:hypothetical protein
MADELVILGTIAIVGLVAVTTIALVYNRSFGFRGDKEAIQIETRADSNGPLVHEASNEHDAASR